MLILSAFAFFLGLVGVAYSLYSLWQSSKPWVRQQRTRRKVNLAQLVNSMAAVHKRVRAVRYKMPVTRNPNLITMFEQTLLSFETLLGALLAMLKHDLGLRGNLRLANVGSYNQSGVSSALALANHITAKVSIIEKALQSEIEGKTVGLNELYPEQTAVTMPGCYFCSKPTPQDKNSGVKVKVDDEVRRVHACPTCREALLLTKKVKVLHFQQDGKTVHWSDYKDFVSNNSYWNLNDSSVCKTEKTKSQLRLLKSDS